MKFDYGHYDQNFEQFSNHKRVNCNIEKTMVLNARKTAVLVLMPGLVDQSWSRTLPSLLVCLFSRNRRNCLLIFAFCSPENLKTKKRLLGGNRSFTRQATYFIISNWLLYLPWMYPGQKMPTGRVDNNKKIGN